MLKRDTVLIELNVIRSIIDLMELERQRNTEQEYKLQIFEQNLLKSHIAIQSLQARLQELEAQLKSVETENYKLKMVNSYQADIIAELQSYADPYSTDGNPICNSYLNQT